MFERFTDRARRVVVLAQEESRLLNHNYIGTEHLLLGLVHEGEGVAAKALEALEISLAAVRREVEAIIGQGGSSPSGHIPFTPRAKKVLELSLREALQLGHNYIGTEHILLGLVREGEGVAAQVLVKLGADLSRVRQQVVQLLSGQVPAGVPAAQPHETFESALGPKVARRFTVAAARTLLLAESEGLRRRVASVGVADLLAGLVAEEDGRAARALAALGVDLDRVRSAVAEAPAGDPDPTGPTATEPPAGGRGGFAPARFVRFIGRRGATPVPWDAFDEDVLDAVERALAEALAPSEPARPAAARAGAEGHVADEQIDTEELLLGIVRQAERADGPAARLLAALGMSPGDVRQALRDLPAEEPDASADEAPDQGRSAEDSAGGQHDDEGGDEGDDEGGAAAGPAG
jgi:ATP-dependent Clp protease ATP-binding subunit ClpA